MSFLDILRTAVFALRGNWMRSMLTSLGVIIGIAAVIVMVSVGQGTQAEIDRMVSGLGSQRLDISPGSRRMGGGARQAGSAFYTLTEGDAEAIRVEIPEVQLVTGQLRGSSQVVFAERNWASSWQGVQPDFFEINAWTLADGSLFEPQDYTGAGKVVILGETVRRELFGDDSGVGQTVRIGRTPFTVVGTLAPKGQGGFGQDQDDVMMVPLETGRRRLLGASGLPPSAVMQIALTVANADDLGYVQGEVEALLRQRHRIAPGAEDDFTVRNISEIVATRTATTRLMSLLLGAVATISLIVGGIGIMNIMLVSVTERIREIGLRMAVGARRSDILQQFLIEAVLVCMIGGLLGIAAALGFNLLFDRLSTSFTMIQSPWAMIAALVSSTLIGITFGFLPARNASRMDPVAALSRG